jgi:predicted SAM-dependent methyltransferase
MKKKSVIPRSREGIRLDIGCGDQKQPGFMGMDVRKLEGVDFVHDVQVFPYPFPDNSCLQLLMSHLWEHIEPKFRVDVMNELWRITKPGGQLLLSCPYATSTGAFQDPTHYPCPNEVTFTYFDPGYPLYRIYKPKPWKIIQNNYVMMGNLEIVMETIKDGTEEKQNFEAVERNEQKLRAVHGLPGKEDIRILRKKNG